MSEAELHRKITHDVNTTMETKISELRKLQAEADARQRQEAAERKKAQEEKLDALLQLQVDQAEQQNNRQVLLNRLLAALVTIVTAAAGGGVYLGTRQNQNPQDAADTVQVKEAVEAQGEGIEKRIELNEKKVERLKDVALEQQVQLSDSTEYIIQKIDAAHPRSPDIASPEAESVEKAKKKAAAIKRSKERESKELFEENVDPFAGLDDAG